MKKNFAIFVCLIALSIITRFIFLERTAIFVNDQGRDLLLVREMVMTLKPTLLGPATSFNSVLGSLYFGPYYFYILVPFYILSKNPLFISAIVPILFVVALTASLFIKKIDTRAKIIFAVLFVGSSYSLWFSRFLWNLNVGVFLSWFVFVLAINYQETLLKRPAVVLGFSILAGAVFQMHYGMLFLYVLLWVFLIPKANKIWFALGFLLSFAPFFYFDIRHDFLISRTLWQIAYSLVLGTYNAGNTSISPTVILAKSFHYYFLPGLSLPNWLLAILFVSAMLSLLGFHFKHRHEGFNRLLLGAYWLFFATFFLFKRSFDYYLLCFLPFLYLSLGMCLSAFIGSHSRSLRWWVVTGLLAVFVYLNVSYYLRGDFSLYALATQEKIAALINNDLTYHKQGVLSLQAWPHYDDRRGIEYILRTRYNRTVLQDGALVYLICYQKNDCPKKNYRRLGQENSVLLYRKK